MSRKIEDYLHLYLGCECKYRTTAIENAQWEWGIVDVRTLHCVYTGLWEIKLILRPISDMTEEEVAVLIEFEKTNDLIPCPHFNNIHQTKHGEQLRLLLAKGFDLFGLIEAGLAIDKTKMNSL